MASLADQLARGYASANQSRRPRGVYSPPPQFTASPMIAGYGGGVSPVQNIQATAPMQAQMTPAQALATYSAFRKEADPNAARRRAMAQTAADFSGPTTSGSITEGLIRMAQAALATRANRDSEMERMQTSADKYNTAQAEFDAGVEQKAQEAGEVGRYRAFDMNVPKPMEVGGRIVDAANNYQELYAPPPNTEELELKREALDLRWQQIAQTAALAGQRIDGGNIKDATTLRKELEGLPTTKAYRLTANAYSQLKAIAEKPSAAGDLSFVFSYMKMLDPESVVREGEFANAQNAAGVPDQVRNLYNRAMSGERLNPTQRAQFLDTAERLMQSAQSQYAQDVERFRSYAPAYGANPDLIATQPNAPKRIKLDPNQ